MQAPPDSLASSFLRVRQNKNDLGTQQLGTAKKVRIVGIVGDLATANTMGSRQPHRRRSATASSKTAAPKPKAGTSLKECKQCQSLVTEELGPRHVPRSKPPDSSDQTLTKTPSTLDVSETLPSILPPRCEAKFPKDLTSGRRRPQSASSVSLLLLGPLSPSARAALKTFDRAVSAKGQRPRSASTCRRLDSIEKKSLLSELSSPGDRKGHFYEDLLRQRSSIDDGVLLQPGVSLEETRLAGVSQRVSIIGEPWPHSAAHDFFKKTSAARPSSCSTAHDEWLHSCRPQTAEPPPWARLDGSLESTLEVYRSTSAHDDAVVFRDIQRELEEKERAFIGEINESTSFFLTAMAAPPPAGLRPSSREAHKLLTTNGGRSSRDRPKSSGGRRPKTPHPRHQLIPGNNCTWSVEGESQVAFASKNSEKIGL